MKFSYRGVNDEDTTAMLEVTERQICRMSQGQNREFPYVRHIPEPLPIINRQFQGFAYGTTLAAPRIASIPRQPLPICDKSEALDELMHSHLKNIWRSLEHRIQVAKASGDQRLVRLLEAESKQMTLTL